MLKPIPTRMIYIPIYASDQHYNVYSLQLSQYSKVDMAVLKETV